MSTETDGKDTRTDTESAMEPDSEADSGSDSGEEIETTSTSGTPDPDLDDTPADVSDSEQTSDSSASSEPDDEESTDSDTEATAPPEQFRAAIQGGELKTVLKTLSAIVDETRIHIDENGLRMRAVDPANVAMDDIELEAAAFESYDASPGLLGVNLDRFSKVVKMANKTDLVQLWFDTSTFKLVVYIDGLEFTMACLDPQTIRSEPTLPELDLPAGATISREALNRGIKAADMVSDHIGIEMVEDEGRLSIDAEGDTDNVRLDLQDDDLQSVTLADARSVFSLDYLKDLVRTMPRGVDVSLRFGSDFPLIIDYEIADGDGHVTRMLAPRIQTD